MKDEPNNLTLSLRTRSCQSLFQFVAAMLSAILQTGHPTHRLKSHRDKQKLPMPQFNRGLKRTPARNVIYFVAGVCFVAELRLSLICWQ